MLEPKFRHYILFHGSVQLGAGWLCFATFLLEALKPLTALCSSAVADVSRMDRQIQ